MMYADEKAGNSGGRSRIDRLLPRPDPSLPRLGRLARQCKRAFLAHPNPTMRELREWCYPGRQRHHWFYINIKRALAKIGAVKIGRARGVGCPAIYALGQPCVEKPSQNSPNDTQ
jgi:hypothetical protein